jgi:hypothetical protein
MTLRDSKEHPIWDVYNELRTARLNVKCLECKIKGLRRKSTILEVIVAISGTSSIGGFWFLQNDFGTTAWKTLGALAVVIGAVKHIFPFGERRLKKERLAAGYRMLEHELQCIRVGIKERRAYDDVAKGEFRIALRNKKELIGQSDDEPCSNRIIKKCRISIDRELPVDEFYIPP